MARKTHNMDYKALKPNVNGEPSTDAEMKALERDLGKLDEQDFAIKDDCKTTIDALLVILQGDARLGTPGLDEQRAQLRQRIAIAVELKERDEAKTLRASYEKTIKRIHAALRRLVLALANDEAQAIRENPINWMHIRANLRPILIKNLKERHDIDLTDVLARAERREALQKAEALRQYDEDVEVDDALEKEETSA